MSARRKATFVTMALLIALTIVGAFASLASAQGNFNFQASQTSNTRGVNDDASYTFTVTNTGTPNLGDINMTVPLGYGTVNDLAVSTQGWNISSQLRDIPNNLKVTDILLSGSNGGLANGQSVTFTFKVKNPQVAGTYTWNVAANNNTSTEALNTSLLTVQVKSNIIITSMLPALAILGIALGIAFLNSGLNRVLINYFIGWEQYRVMQKEMAEYRSETMAAARAGDKKQMEKLKKKQSQINNMQAKMMKPQMVQFGISAVYIVVWILVLTPTFQNISLAYLPGLGPIPVFYLYPILSFFLGLVSSRIIGIMPIEN